MIAKADEAMYQAKNEGRNKVVLYTPEGEFIHEGFAILVVDDSAVVVGAPAGSAAFDGYTVYTAGDGIEALDVVKQQHIDLILLDIDMRA